MPRVTHLSRRSRTTAVVGAATVALTAGSLTAAALSHPTVLPGAASGTSYTNPVSRSFADTYADPAVIHGKDGWWYAYATADPLRAGDPPGIIHIARTRDFVTWDYRGTVFGDTNRPTWATATSGLWAPDIRYVDGRYVLYYTVTDTTLNSGDDSAIGVATAPTPEGPWTAADQPVVAPRPKDGGFLWTFDPALFTDADGQNYLYYGSYFGGLWATKVSRDGLRPIGAATQVAIDNRYEGSYVTRHDGWYYLQASSANCCAGPSTGYAVFAGRSRSPLGPFVDADGISLLASAVGGTSMVQQNGNRWIGTGHHAIATDATGRDFVAYHALDKANPWLTEPFGINRRPMLLDRLDWVDGWPKTRAGWGPSDDPQPAPVTTSLLGIDSADPAGALVGALTAVSDAQGGTSVRLTSTARTRQAAPAGPLRVRLDLKGGQSTTVTLGAGASRVTAEVDPRRGTLTLTDGEGGRRRTASDTIRSSSGWRTLALEVSETAATAYLSESDLNDPEAEVSLARTSSLRAGPLRPTSRGGLVDNLTVQRLADDTAAPAPVPQPTARVFRDDFTSGLAPGWTWVRPDGDITVADGSLRWPLKSVDIVGGGNSGALLLRDVPAGDWIAETRLTLDLGNDEVRNYQQAGLVVHNTDDDFARLGVVAIWNTRQTEFGREVAAAPDGRTSWGGTLIGTPAATTWLRIAHHVAPSGERVYRAATSRDGSSWTWGGAWTFPATATPRIGLYAGGGATPAAVAAFDSFTLSAATVPVEPTQ